MVKQIEKTKFDRVKESVALLKQLQEMGIMDENEGYLETKSALDQWIKTGEATEHLIFFRSYRRKGFLTLPSRADRAAEFVLKAL